jgi:hypothetical protein
MDWLLDRLEPIHEGMADIAVHISRNDAVCLDIALYWLRSPNATYIEYNNSQVMSLSRCA